MQVWRMCSKCQEQKPITEFYKRSDTHTGGYATSCRICWGKHYAEYRRVTREKVFDHYGRVCACCGELDDRFLTIDHVNGNGNAHRKSISPKNKGGYAIYTWFVANDFPSGFQTLCWNCNLGKYHYGICPHKL